MPNQSFAISAGLNTISLALGSGGPHRLRFVNTGNKTLYLNFGATIQTGGTWPTFVLGYNPKGRDKHFYDPRANSREDLITLQPNQGHNRTVVTSDGNVNVQCGTLNADITSLLVIEGPNED